MTDIQQLLQDSLDPYLNSLESSLALGITFGIKNLFDAQFSNEIKIVGVSHMMVLSGTNISMFIHFISSVLFFVPSKIREVISIIAVILFLSLIPLQPSILRAAIMSIIPRIGGLLGKQSHPMYLLLLTCALILCFDIQILYDISFQLSFLAVFGILLFYREPENRNQTMDIVRVVSNTIKSQALLGFSAQVFTVPLIFYYFGTISAISPLTNLILSPLISPIMFGTMILILSNNAFSIIGKCIAIPLRIIIYCMIQIIRILSRADFLYIRY